MTYSNTPIAGDSDEYTFVQEAPELGDLRQLISDRGLDPAQWTVVSTTLNEWDSALAGGGTQRLQQWKVVLKRAPHLILPQPAVHVPKVRTKPPRRSGNSPELIMVLSDHQAPYHDPALHSASLEALSYFRRHNLVEIIHLGDLLDFPTISKHPAKPGEATVQECIQAGYEILRDLAEVGGVPMKLIPGNHEFRLQQFMYDKAREIYGITPAAPKNMLVSREDGLDAPGHQTIPALSLVHLLHLTCLNTELCESPLGWEHSEVEIVADSLVARHGWLTQANSAEKSLLKRGRSIVFGHLHRRDTIYRWDASAEVERQAHCLGMMAKRGGDYPNFAVCNDWTQGFATVTRFPDNSWTVDHALWDGHTLTWRNQQFD